MEVSPEGFFRFIGRRMAIVQLATGAPRLALAMVWPLGCLRCMHASQGCHLA